MRGQAGIIVDWYKNNNLIVESKGEKIKKSINIGNGTVQSTISLYNVSLDENGAKYECRGRYPGVPSFLYSSFPILLRVGGTLIKFCCLEDWSRYSRLYVRQIFCESVNRHHFLWASTLYACLILIQNKDIQKSKLKPKTRKRAIFSFKISIVAWIVTNLPIHVVSLKRCYLH